ncbi:hypothetical protein Leryth_009937, partial [Lithospermum erythrorhizon]
NDEHLIKFHSSLKLSLCYFASLSTPFSAHPPYPYPSGFISMGSTSTLSLCSHPNVHFGVFCKKDCNFSKNRELGFQRVLFPSTTLVYIHKRNNFLRICSRNDGVYARASGSRQPGSSRRVYRESQSQGPAFPVQEIGSFVVPAGAFVAVTFGTFGTEMLDWLMPWRW